MTSESNSSSELDWNDRNTFLNLAGGIEGGLALVAMFLAWFFELDLWAITAIDWTACGHALLALLPMLVLFAVTYRWPIGSMKTIKQLLLEVMGPPLSACRWYDLPLLAALAGIGEELLFRGVLQTGLDAGLGRGAGLLIAAILFGLLHAITPTYAVLAGLIGVYLGWLLYLWQPANLFVPILVHGTYDFIAFLILRYDYRRNFLNQPAEFESAD